MIKIENVYKKYKNLEIFNDLNVEFKEGKKYLIQGANGSGKSVLLKLIVGYSHPSNGKIISDELVIGKDVDFLPNSGVSINAPEFIANLTGLENLLYLAKINNIASQETILNLARKLEFENDINKKYKNYSLGMKQKMRLIQALMDNPKYLILDEPFDALDKKTRKVVLDILKDYINNDKLLIYTSHIIEDETFADVIFECTDCNLIRINNGRNDKK